MPPAQTSKYWKPRLQSDGQVAVSAGKDFRYRRRCVRFIVAEEPARVRKRILAEQVDRARLSSNHLERAASRPEQQRPSRTPSFQEGVAGCSCQSAPAANRYLRVRPVMHGAVPGAGKSGREAVVVQVNASIPPTPIPVEVLQAECAPKRIGAVVQQAWTGPGRRRGQPTGRAGSRTSARRQHPVVRPKCRHRWSWWFQRQRSPAELDERLGVAAPLPGSSGRRSVSTRIREWPHSHLPGEQSPSSSRRTPVFSLTLKPARGSRQMNKLGGDRVQIFHQSRRPEEAALGKSGPGMMFGKPWSVTGC